MIKVGIVGNKSDVLIELLGILVNHPDVELVFVDSEKFCGRKISDVFRRFYGDTDLIFSDKSPLDIINVLFCCNTKGQTMAYMRETMIPKDLKIIDLSPDFRTVAENNVFEYGLPELNRRATCSSYYVSNPGAIPACIELALLPLAKNLLLNSPVYISLVAGSSAFDESDKKTVLSLMPSLDSSEYDEIRNSLLRLQKSFDSEINIISVKTGMNKGVMVNILTEVGVDLCELKELYCRYYEADSFTFLVENPSLDDVLNTNKCFIGLSELNGKLLVTCCIDDMIKGCVGQAVHNMNLMFNLEETVGLTFCSSILSV